MTPKWPIIRRPVRLAAVLALATAALISTGTIFIGETRPQALVFAVGYGAFVGWYAVGLALAARFRVASWFLLSGLLPVALLATAAFGWCLAPRVIMRWWPLLGRIMLVVLWSWGLTGALLATLGWWFHARGACLWQNARGGYRKPPSDRTAP